MRQHRAPPLPASLAGTDFIPPQKTRRVSTSFPASIDGKAKTIALARLDLVKAWQEYRDRYLRKTEADREFINGYNSGVLCPKIYSILGKVTVRTLYHWQALLDGTEDYTQLIPGWFFQANEDKDTIPSYVKDVLMGILLHPNRIKVGTAIRLTRYYLERKGLDCPVSDITLRRYVEKYKKRHYDRWVLHREGQKALRDKVEPFIRRDPSLLEVGDVLVADGHRLNFQVINPFTGKPCRATLVGYLDWKSYALVGYEIMLEENTQCIASALRNSILNLGKIPKITYQDNGKAFRARFFTGTPSFDESGLYGLFARLGIIPVFAQPYNARAKTIERWFQEFTDTFERLLPSFTGTNINDKPAHLLRNEKFHKALHKEYIPTIEETIQLINSWLEFHYSQPCPHVRGKTIGEVFREGRGSGVDEAELDDLMMEMKVTKIGRNGIRFLKAEYYDDNLYGLNDQVIIKYSLFDLSRIKIYSMKGKYICTATRQMPVHPMAEYLGDVKDIEELKRRLAQQRRLERKTIELAKEFCKKNKHIELDWQKAIEISPKVIEKIEKTDIALPYEEIHIPQECVKYIKTPQPEKQAYTERPIFQSGIERYKWHMEHGVQTKEDEEWIAWFKTTTEYKLGIEYFEKQ
ncbi:Mu transposase C-terminal domain-containing protein [Thermodesulfovibrio sp.]|uniref:Mu transposase C-terminal domain-containing protein n=1 Tax=Thermodesulfovibrio sp. TaxID=2067987 RepID=UPI00309F46C9